MSEIYFTATDWISVFSRSTVDNDLNNAADPKVTEIHSCFHRLNLFCFQINRRQWSGQSGWSKVSEINLSLSSNENVFRRGWGWVQFRITTTGFVLIQGTYLSGCDLICMRTSQFESKRKRNCLERQRLSLIRSTETFKAADNRES